MNELHFCWLALTIGLPVAGAICIPRFRPEAVRRWCAVFSGLSVLCALAALVDYLMLPGPEAVERWNITRQLTGRSLLVLDGLNAPLLPLAGLLFFLTVVTTQGVKVRRFPFDGTLVSQAIVSAALCTKEPWLIVGLLVAETVPPLLELRSRRKPARVFGLHMMLFAGLLILGQLLVTAGGDEGWWPALFLTGAVLVRSGATPFHCWLTDLFEHATLGTALLFVTPLMGAYATVRLVLPVAPEEVLRGAGWVSLFTAIYAAGMALVQKEARRFFCYIFLSHSALVLVGLETLTPIGLTGALCGWLSVGPALTGFGLTLRALEARHRRLLLTTYHGLYDHTPALAICFLLTGLASIGFPGTLGFLANELLVNGAVTAFPGIGLVVVFAAALNGIAMVRVYFLLFAGTRHVSTVPLRIARRERLAVLTLAALIVGGGLFPQPGVAWQHETARFLIGNRATMKVDKQAE